MANVRYGNVQSIVRLTSNHAVASLIIHETAEVNSLPRDRSAFALRYRVFGRVFSVALFFFFPPFFLLVFLRDFPFRSEAHRPRADSASSAARDSFLNDSTTAGKLDTG